MTITIQPVQTGADLPYPFHVDEEGFIGRQEFWKGKPYKLVGFASRPIAGQMDVFFADFWKDPELAIGKFPVFADKKKDWFTHSIAIASFHENK